MKFSRFDLVFAVILFLATLASAQEVKLPDYSKWTGHALNFEIVIVVDGRTVIVTGGYYLYIDMENLKRHNVQIINNEQKKPWLAIYAVEVGEKDSEGHISTKETHGHVFENVDGKWVLVNSIVPVSDDVGLRAFLKERYKLEY